MGFCSARCWCLGGLRDAGRRELDDHRPPAHETASERRRRERDEWRDPKAALGALPLARRDVERLRQILGLQRRLLDMAASPRAKRALMSRGPFAEALTWLEIHGQRTGNRRALARLHRSHGRDATARGRNRSGRRRAPADAPTAPAAAAADGRRRADVVYGDRPIVDSCSDLGASRYPLTRSNSRMKSTSISTPRSGNAL